MRNLAWQGADDVRAAGAQGKAVTGDARQPRRQDRAGCAQAAHGEVEEGTGVVRHLGGDPIALSGRAEDGENRRRPEEEQQRQAAEAQCEKHQRWQHHHIQIWLGHIEQRLYPEKFWVFWVHD